MESYLPRLFSNSPLSRNQIYLRNPWVVVWWSAAFPGFGHLMINSYLYGFILIIFEYALNNFAQINTSIFLSLIGDIEKAKEVINIRWFFAYMGVYVFTMYDSYRRTVELNKVFMIGYRPNMQLEENVSLTPMGISMVEKNNPILPIIWSAVSPGLGYMYSHQIPNIIFGLFWWGVVLYMSHLLEGIYFTAIGQFEAAASILDPQWFLFIPSIYTFIMYNSYQTTVQNNRLYELSLSRQLKDEYQNKHFLKPF